VGRGDRRDGKPVVDCPGLLHQRLAAGRRQPQLQGHLDERGRETLAFTVVADGTTEEYDCRLFLPSYSGAGNLLTVRNTGNTRVQISPCRITALPCP
jgi:hypothetical protein